MQSVIESPVTRINGRWIWVPSNEEIPTTFQIGVIGSDGVLLASDRCASDNGTYRSSYETRKIRYSDGNFACCASGMPVVDSAAKDADEQYSDGSDIQEFIALRCRSAKQAAPPYWNASDPSAFQGVLLFVHRDEDRMASLWQIQLEPHMPRRSDVQKVFGHRFYGDTANAACFFMERYRTDELVPVDDLVSLVAHTIFMAAPMNPRGVRGLDILLCRHGDQPFEWITEDRIKELKRQSDKLDGFTREQLLPPVYHRTG